MFKLVHLWFNSSTYLPSNVIINVRLYKILVKNKIKVLYWMERFRSRNNIVIKSWLSFFMVYLLWLFTSDRKSFRQVFYNDAFGRRVAWFSTNPNIGMYGCMVFMYAYIYMCLCVRWKNILLLNTHLCHRVSKIIAISRSFSLQII